jgi:hypothetical protein
MTPLLNLRRRLVAITQQKVVSGPGKLEVLDRAPHQFSKEASHFDLMMRSDT